MLRLIEKDEISNILESDKGLPIYKKEWAEGLEPEDEIPTIERLVVPKKTTLEELKEDWVEKED